MWSGSDQVGPSRIRSDQVGLGRIFRKFRNIRIFREMLLTQMEVCILSRVIYTAWQICKMDGDEGKTFYVIRFLDHFFENCCIELPYQYFISFNSGLAIRSPMDPVLLLYLHDPTRTTIGFDFYTCTIRPDPTRTGDPIRRGLAIRSDYYTCLVSHACDVTLSVYPHRAGLKNMPDHGGNRTYDLWNTSPMLWQLSYAVWSVRVCDISEQNLVPSILMLSNNNLDFSGIIFTIASYSPSHHIHLSTLHQHRKIKIMFLVPARMGFICRTKIFHYSLFLKNRLNKTPNSSPDQSLIAAFRKRNSNCIFLKILLAWYA